MLSAAAKAVLPLTAEDVYAHGLRIIHYDWLTSENGVYAKARREEVETHGSNGWAIAPSKTASGNAMLLSNSHLAWGDQDTYFEVQLTAPGVTSYGAVWVGFPVLRQCFTEFVAWTQTTNGPTGADVYRLTLKDGGYVLDGQTKAFEVEKQIIKVRQADGTLRDEPLTIRRSVHGPVFSDRRGVTVALRVVAADRPRMFEQFWRMGLARNFDEWRDAMRMQQLPIFHTMYADRDGHIMYVYNAAPPVRANGNHAYWNGVRPRRSIGCHCHRQDRAVRSTAAGDRSAERLGAELQRFAVDLDLSDGPRSGEVRGVYRAAAEPHAAIAAQHPPAVAAGQDHARRFEGDEALDAQRDRRSLRRRSRRRRAAERQRRKRRRPRRFWRSGTARARPRPTAPFCSCASFRRAGNGFQNIGGYAVPADPKQPLTTPWGFADPAKSGAAARDRSAAPRDRVRHACTSSGAM